MVGTSHTKSVLRDLGERPQPVHQAAGICFIWSLSKIRIAGLILFGAATPTAVSLALSIALVKWLCLAWLLGIALLLNSLDRRARANTVVLSVDQLGIFDRRLMSRHIEWEEIDSICPINADRSHVVDIRLRSPRTTLRETRWPVRIGAHCQLGYGIPAVSISMLLLEGNAPKMLEAIARYRPDLLHHTNRKAPLSAQQ